MSKGNPIVPVRVPEDVLAKIDREVERSVHRFSGKLDRSAFIRLAIAEKLDHMRRSRNRKVAKRLAK